MKPQPNVVEDVLKEEQKDKVNNLARNIENISPIKNDQSKYMSPSMPQGRYSSVKSSQQSDPKLNLKYSPPTITAPLQSRLEHYKILQNCHPF